MTKDNTLYILSHGRVAAINKNDGAIIWEVKLKAYGGSSMVYAIGQLMVEGQKIYIGCSGLLFCLHTRDGSLLWKNELKGWGYNFVSLANVNNSAAASAAAMQQAANAGATTS